MGIKGDNYLQVTIGMFQRDVKIEKSILFAYSIRV